MGDTIDIIRRRPKRERADVDIASRFGRLVVLRRGADRFHGKDRKRFPTWTCRCDCGAEKDILDNALRCGRSTSCGCLRRERAAVAIAKLDVKGPKNPRWKGGRQVTRRGYVEVWIPRDHPFFAMARGLTGVGGYVFEHRLVMALALGRPLADHEEVHHIDGDRRDNRLANLQLRFTPHGAGAAFRCADCGSCNVAAVPLAPSLGG